MSTQSRSRIQWLSEEYTEYLRDESRRIGRALHIAFPETEEDVANVLLECAQQGESVTVQGARTGVTAGAVPEGGCVLNLSRMRRCADAEFDTATGRATLRVQPGLSLRELRNTIRQLKCPANAPVGFFFPPDPTETSASLGGMIACNASGAESFHYGSTRSFVLGLRIVLAHGDTLSLRRGREIASGREFAVRTESGRLLEGRLPSYAMPLVKSAAGYYAQDNMDMLDLFIGSEGTLGVVTEAELLLLPAPAITWGVVGFLRDAARVIDAVNAFRVASFRPVAIEYFDEEALRLLNSNRERIAILHALPELKREWKAALYVEIHADDENQAADALMEVAGLFEAAGVSEEETWSAMDGGQMQKLKDFRHAVPESVNMRIDELRQNEPRLTKLGTDMAVPDERLGDVLAMYRDGLTEAGLEAVQFGHIGNNHIHVNILPRTWHEYKRGKQLYKEWATQVVKWGGTISAEHGVGKLKAPLLREMYGEQGIQQMRAVKKVFDPDFILGPGTLLG